MGEDVLLSGNVSVVMEGLFGTEPFMSGGIAEELTVHGDSRRINELMPSLYDYLLG